MSLPWNGAKDLSCHQDTLDKDGMQLLIAKLRNAAKMLT
jgi:hypothetical protein